MHLPFPELCSRWNWAEQRPKLLLYVCRLLPTDSNFCDVLFISLLDIYDEKFCCGVSIRCLPPAVTSYIPGLDNFYCVLTTVLYHCISSGSSPSCTMLASRTCFWRGFSGAGCIYTWRLRITGKRTNYLPFQAKPRRKATAGETFCTSRSAADFHPTSP